MSAALDNARAADFLEWLWEHLDFGPATEDVLDACAREYADRAEGELPSWLADAVSVDTHDDDFGPATDE